MRALFRRAAAAAAVAGVDISARRELFAAAAPASAPSPVAGSASKEPAALPEFTAAEVAAHTSAERGGVWVSWHGGVYDVSSFIARHPGGASRLQLAAGGPLEPFWAVFPQHLASPAVPDLLSSMRIGTLAASDAAAVRATEAAAGDPFAGDPQRSPLLRVHSARPFNAEPAAPSLLIDSYITPAALAFVRHHLPVPPPPLLDEGAQELRVTLARPGAPAERVYTMRELKARFAARRVVAALTCSGNRRGDMEPGAHGLAWGAGAMANLEWRGVALRDVLADAGLSARATGGGGGGGGGGDEAEPWLRHVQFVGADADPRSGTHYAASIPADVALDARRDVLLAYELNGEPIPRDHGGPLRVVVPGATGARQVKWLERVVAAADEADSAWQRRDYRLWAPAMSDATVDYDSAPSMLDMAVQSAICEPHPPVPPARTAAVTCDADGALRVRGWAWAGGGRAIQRVDVSADGGTSWLTADIDAAPDDDSPSRTRSWGWTLWSAHLRVPPGEAELVCRAVDIAGNAQPQQAPWNWRGLGNNGCHRVRVEISNAGRTG